MAFPTNTPHRERKRIVRLLIEDVTLHQDKQITLQIRFKGGTSRTLTLPRPISAPELFVTAPHIVAEIDRLLDEETEAQIAARLNERGILTARGLPFTVVAIQRIRLAYNLKSRYDRLRQKGWLTRKELGQCLQLHWCAISNWQRQQRLASEVVDERGYRLYPPLDNLQIEILKQTKGSHNHDSKLSSNHINKVQYAT